MRPDTLTLSRPAVSALMLTLLLLATPTEVVANNTPDRSEAESRLQQVTKEIRELMEQLEKSRTEHRKEQVRLKDIDLEIQRANQSYRSLEQDRLVHLQELDLLESRRKEHLSKLSDRQEQLAEQVRSSYRAGKQSRMKLVLNQDDPVVLGRMLAYFDYMNRAQAGKINKLREDLAILTEMQLKIDGELDRIGEVQSEQQSVLETLARQRGDRESLLASLAGQISSDESRLRELERNQRDLEALLERLTDALADIPEDLEKQIGISGRKGRLPMPVKGPVKYAFGQNRTGGMTWQGWLIGAATGTDVGAVGYGRVAFADWLRGYGLLIIIDHGEGYLSLYGNNESMLRDVGEWVEPSEIIGTVGSNPGKEQGLYFELRKNGKAVDPATWMAR